MIDPDHCPPIWPKPQPGALAGTRICDFTGQLAGAGATKILAALGAEVIRIEDPVRQGRWDILRGTQPFVGEHRGIEAGGSFNNHNAGKLGLTLNLRDDRAKDLHRRSTRRRGRSASRICQGRAQTCYVATSSRNQSISSKQLRRLAASLRVTPARISWRVTPHDAR
ncbi:CoA transferase [Candidatus Poriferisodalis sp.]|uniref:CoA transferase n=1 Tax=Candidatus Poriferisodalis sp. TaxID=3101277 RepID=UPI003B02AD3A